MVVRRLLAAVVFCAGVFGAFGCQGPASELITPPAVLNWYPVGSATCVPRDTRIWITFSDEMDAASINAQSVMLENASGTLAISLAWDPDTQTVMLTPSSILTYDTTFSVHLASSIANTEGGTLGAEVSSGFTTLPQAGCAAGLVCGVDADCAGQICSITGTCVDDCAVPEDCADSSQICDAGVCTTPPAEP